MTNARINYAGNNDADKYQFTSGEGLGFLGPPSWNSKSFNLLNFLPPEMVSPVVLLHELPSL